VIKKSPLNQSFIVILRVVVIVVVMEIIFTTDIEQVFFCKTVNALKKIQIQKNYEGLKIQRLPTWWPPEMLVLKL
jgi:hypothetical protein